MAKVIVACDSFKGSLTSAEVAQAVAAGIKSCAPDCEVMCISVADGGEGTCEALTNVMNGSVKSCRVHDPLGNIIEARYAIVNCADKKVALIEMAAASGLTLVNPNHRNVSEESQVMRASTFGTGEMIIDAYRNGCREFIIGLGGSATCDCGTGMLAAFGFRFLDADGQELEPNGKNLSNIRSVDKSRLLADMRAMLRCSFTIACDVENPLFGKSGAAYVYAPQKGANAEEVTILDSGLKNIAAIVKSDIDRDFSFTPGAGAAGGMGFALMAYCNGSLKSGAEIVLDAAGFDKKIEDADLVITGEGKMDKQTLDGKLPYRVLRRAQAKGVSTIAICGIAENREQLLDAGFMHVYALYPDGIVSGNAMEKDVAFENVKSLAQYITTQKL